MKNKLKLRSFVVAIIPMICACLGMFLGARLAPYLYFTLPPFWRHDEIFPFLGAKEILSVDSLFLYSPNGDVLYIISDDDVVFSNRLFEGNWNIVKSVPEQRYAVSSCVSEWDVPVKRDVLDSIGVTSTDYETSSMSRCYVLFEDGSMQVWTNTMGTSDVFIALIVGGAVGYLAGTIVGVLISVYVLHNIWG